jgi:NAD-dependent deacetylase
MSKESGIPTFRDAPNALWEKYNPEELATREGFRRDPELVWRWYADRRAMIARARPHAGHVALARLEPFFDQFVLLTQNIDGLHLAAGSKQVVELHGNIFRYKCFDRNHPTPDPGATGAIPPRCACGSFLRPDIVWFGEVLAAADLERAYAALALCEALLVVGTSGVVYPAAGFVEIAKSAGARVIDVNPETTPLSALADVVVEAGARESLPLIVERVARLRGAAS